MLAEISHQSKFQNLYSLQELTDNDLVLLLAGAYQIRDFLKIKIQYKGQLSPYHAAKLNEFESLVKRLENVCNTGHIIEAKTLQL